MKRCNNLVDVGRRRFLTGAGVATAGAAAAAMMPTPAKASPTSALVKYPADRLANLSDLKVDEPFAVAYPDDDAPGVLIKLGTPVPGGVGPDGDILSPPDLRR